MTEPLPDPRLLRLITERDELRKQLRVERIRSSNLKARVERLVSQKTMDAKPVQPDRHAGC